MDGDIICRECSLKCAAMLKAARARTAAILRSFNTLTEQQVLTAPAAEAREDALTEKQKTPIFLPSEPYSKTPTGTEAMEDKTSFKMSTQDGAGAVPSGLTLAILIEKKLGFTPKNRGMKKVLSALPKVLVEDLEIARKVGIEVKGDKIHFNLADSIYSDLCKQIRESGRRCALDCPLCSALAITLTNASGKLVVVDEDELTTGKGTPLCSYKILNSPKP